MPRFEEIPNSLNEGVHDYSIVLFGYDDLNTAPAHCGMGTLVKFRDDHYILTAGHCAARLAEYDKIAISVRPHKRQVKVSKNLTTNRLNIDIEQVRGEIEERMAQFRANPDLLARSIPALTD